MIPAAVHHALQCVGPLKKGRVPLELSRTFPADLQTELTGSQLVIMNHSEGKAKNIGLTVDGQPIECPSDTLLSGYEMSVHTPGRGSWAAVEE
jgi:hypothetical protein